MWLQGKIQLNKILMLSEIHSSIEFNNVSNIVESIESSISL